MGSAARIAPLRSRSSAVVGDPEQPGAQWRRVLQLVHGE
jgi:hypothetical protein